MKRDDWELGNGLKSGDSAILDNSIPCRILKIKGNRISSEDVGNALIEVCDDNGDLRQFIVLGNRLTIVKEENDE
jgi:hypothetical protein